MGQMLYLSIPHLIMILIYDLPPGLLARVTWPVPLVKQELSTVPEHMSSPRAAQSVFLCVIVCICSFSFGDFMFFPFTI